MINDPATGALKPFDFHQIKSEVPELSKIACNISSVSFDEPIDSSNMNPEIWKKLVQLIEVHYENYDGFVILHGTDTMAYSASALSFMIQDLNKPIVFTGSQLPIGIIRTDGKENLITAIEIASTYIDGVPKVPEVSIYFEYKLYRGNRTTKLSSTHFNAFASFNYPFLAEAGIDIKFNKNAISSKRGNEPNYFYELENDIGILQLHPGISKKHVKHFFTSPGIKAVVLQTFGAGNGPTESWFIDEIKAANDAGIIVVNITQCLSGGVNQDKYETGRGLVSAGVISGGDLTIEAALCKLMYLLGRYDNRDTVKDLFVKNIAGEITN
jgi:L-asparaginase